MPTTPAVPPGFLSTDPGETPQSAATPPAPTAATSTPGDDEPSADPEEFPTPPGTVVDDPRDHNVQKDPREHSIWQDPRDHSVQKKPAGDYVTIPGVSYPLEDEPPANAIPVIPRTPELTPLPNDSVGLGRAFRNPDNPGNTPGPTSPRPPDITNPLSDRHLAAPETDLDAGLGKTPDSLAMPSRYATEPNSETPGAPQKPAAPHLNPHSLEYSEDPSRLPAIGGVPHLSPAPQPKKREGKRLVTRMGAEPEDKPKRRKKQPPPPPPPPPEDATKTPISVPTPGVRSDAKNSDNRSSRLRDPNRPGQDTTHITAGPPRDFTRIRDGITAAYRQTEGAGELHPLSQALGRMDPLDLALLSELSPLVRRRVIDVVSAVEKNQELSPLQGDAIKAFVRLLPIEPLDSTGTLTDLEFTELRLVAEDKSLREIGVLIGLKETTVRAHLVRIERKLGAEDRVTAVVAAIRKNILPQTLDQPADRSRSPLPGLTPRETEVLALVAEGKSSPEIATQLDISVAAVDSLVERAGEKLGSPTRAGMVAVAVSTDVLPRTTQGGDSGQALPELTQREIEVLTLIAKGKTSAEIADDLALTPQTVESYASRINRKLEVGTRAGSVAIVIRTGIIPPIDATESDGAARPELTPREREVLGLVAKGENDNEIAAALGLTRQSVKTYVSNINQKFGTHHRAGMAAFALRTGNLPLIDAAPVVRVEKAGSGGGSPSGRRPTRPHGAVDSYYDADPAAALGLSPSGYPRTTASHVPGDVPRWAMGFNRNPDTGEEWGDASEQSGLGDTQDRTAAPDLPQPATAPVHISGVQPGDSAQVDRVHREITGLLPNWDPDYVSDIADAVAASVRWGQGDIEVTATVTDTALRILVTDTTSERSYTSVTWHLDRTPGPVERAARPPGAAHRTESANPQRMGDDRATQLLAESVDDRPAYQAGIGRARRALSQRLQEEHPWLSDDQIWSIELMFSELFTNAEAHLYHHAAAHGMDPNTTVEVDETGTEGERVVEVRIINELAPGQAGHIPPWSAAEQASTREGGRGTQLVHTQSDQCARIITLSPNKNTIAHSFEIWQSAGGIRQTGQDASLTVDLSGLGIAPAELGSEESESPAETPTTLQRAQEGDEAAFQELREEHGVTIFRRVRHALGVPTPPKNPGEARLLQVAQEINRTVFQSADRQRWPVTEGEDVDEWLRGIAGEVVDRWRQLNSTQRKLVLEAVDARQRGTDISVLQRGALERLVPQASVVSNAGAAEPDAEETDIAPVAPDPEAAARLEAERRAAVAEVAADLGIDTGIVEMVLQGRSAVAEQAVAQVREAADRLGYWNQVTKPDVARAAGVSLTTVDRVLGNGRGGLDDHTRQLVLRVAAEIGYTGRITRAAVARASGVGVATVEKVLREGPVLTSETASVVREELRRRGLLQQPSDQGLPRAGRVAAEATAVQVAERAGVSPQKVYGVLRGEGTRDPETATRVLEEADAAGFRPQPPGAPELRTVTHGALRRAAEELPDEVAEYVTRRYLEGNSPEDTRAALGPEADIDQLHRSALSYLGAFFAAELSDNAVVYGTVREATVADAAWLAGTTTDTAARALAGDEVTEESANRVLEAAAQIGLLGDSTSDSDTDTATGLIFEQEPEPGNGLPGWDLMQNQAARPKLADRADHATLTQLARAADVDLATAHWVLLGGSGPDADSVRQVLDAAEGLGFRHTAQTTSADGQPPVAVPDVAQRAGVTDAEVQKVLGGAIVEPDIARRVWEAVGALLPESAPPRHTNRVAVPRGALERAIGRLPERLATYVSLRYLEGLTPAQATAAVGLAPQASQRIGQAAIRQLFVHLQDELDVDLPRQSALRRVRIEDVAQAVGVGSATIHRVLQGNEALDPDVARRVWDAVSQLGFRRLRYTSDPLPEDSDALTGLAFVPSGTAPVTFDLSESWFAHQSHTIDVEQVRALRIELSELLGVDPHSVDQRRVRAELHRPADASQSPDTARLIELGERFLDIDEWDLGQRPTRTAVAALADVSHKTVITVLDNRGSVRPETRQRVLAAAQWLGLMLPRDLREAIDPTFAENRFTPGTFVDGEFVRGEFRRQPSFNEIGQAVGLDPTTVGQILNGKLPANTPRGRRVIAAAERLGRWQPTDPRFGSGADQRLEECIVQVTSALWALGKDGAQVPRPGDNNWRAVEAAIEAGLIKVELEALTEQPRSGGHRVRDPLESVVANLRDEHTNADTAVILVDDGRKMHVYIVTNAGDQVVVFDILARGTDSPGVRHYDDWTPSYLHIEEAFVAYLESDNGALKALTQPSGPDPQRPVPRDGPITGPPAAGTPDVAQLRSAVDTRLLGLVIEGVEAEREAAAVGAPTEVEPVDRLDEILAGLNELRDGMTQPDAEVAPSRFQMLVQHYHAVMERLAAMTDAANITGANRGPTTGVQQVYDLRNRNQRVAEATRRFAAADIRVDQLAAILDSLRTGGPTGTGDRGLLEAVDIGLLRALQAELQKKRDAARTDPRTATPAQIARTQKLHGMFRLVDELLRTADDPDVEIADDRLRNLVFHFHAAAEWVAFENANDADATSVRNVYVRGREELVRAAVDRFRNADERVRALTHALYPSTPDGAPPGPATPQPGMASEVPGQVAAPQAGSEVGLDTPQILDALRQMFPNASFDDIVAWRELSFQRNGLSAPDRARESLEILLRKAWERRAEIGTPFQIYRIQIGYEEGVSASDPVSYLRELVEILEHRSPENRIAYSQTSAGQLEVRLGDMAAVTGDPAAVHFLRFSRPGEPRMRGFRVYIHPSPDTAPGLMRDFVREVIDQPDRFPGVRSAKIAGPVVPRNDGIVTNVNTLADAVRVLAWLRDYQQAHPDSFLWSVPAMTFQVLPGVSLGAEPVYPLSFGEVRSQAIFVALRSTLEVNGDFATFRHRALAALAAADVDPDHPWLPAGSPAWRDHHEVDLISAAGVTDRGGRTDERHNGNEDSFGLTTARVGDEQWTAAAVADGVSAQGHSEEASEAAAQAATGVLHAEAARVARGESPDPIGTAKRAFEAADRAVRELISTKYADSELPPATTLVLTIATPTKLITLSRGDSPAFWIPRDGGPAIPLTEVDPAIVELAESLHMSVHELRHSWLAAGVRGYLGKDTQLGELRPLVHHVTESGFVALFSDGAVNIYYEDESSADTPEQRIADTLRQKLAESSGNLLGAARAFVQHAIDGDEHDNVTAVLIDSLFQNPGTANAQPNTGGSVAPSNGPGSPGPTMPPEKQANPTDDTPAPSSHPAQQKRPGGGSPSPGPVVSFQVVDPFAPERPARKRHRTLTGILGPDGLDWGVVNYKNPVTGQFSGTDEPEEPANHSQPDGGDTPGAAQSKPGPTPWQLATAPDSRRTPPPADVATPGARTESTPAEPLASGPVRPEDALDARRRNPDHGQRIDPARMNAIGDKVGPEAWAFKKPGQGVQPNRAPGEAGVRATESEKAPSDPGEEAPAPPPLVRAARDGDSVAFDRLRADLTDPILQWMSARMAGDRAAAEGLTDEVFARAATGIGRLHAEQDIKQWLSVIARNVLVEHRRYERLRDGIWASYAGPRNTESGPRGGLLARADRATVLRAVHQLPSDHRKVLVWRFEQDKTATQIAESMPSAWESRTVRRVERRAAQRVVEMVAAELGVVVGGRSAERQQQWRVVQEADPGELERHIQMLPERQREIAGLLLRSASHGKAAKALGTSSRQLRATLYQQIVPALATLLTGGVVLTDHEAVKLTRAAQRHDSAVLAPYVPGLDPLHQRTFEQFFIQRRTVNEMAAAEGAKISAIYMRVYRVAQFMARKVPAELRESYANRGLLQAATTHDVAREAGVSQSTAEKVLRGTGEFAPETKRRVLEAADRLGHTFVQREGVAPPLRVVGPAEQYRHMGGDAGYRMTRYEAHVLFESAVRSGTPTVGDFSVRIPDASTADGRPLFPEHELWQMMPPHVQRFRKVLHLLTDVRLPDGRILDSSTPVLIEQRPLGAVPTDFQFDRLRAMVLRSMEGLRRALGEIPVEPLRQWLPGFPEDRDTEGFLRFLTGKWTGQVSRYRQAGWAEMFTDLEIPGRDPFAAILEQAIFMIPARFEVLHGRLGRENIRIDRGRITAITGWAGALIGDPAFDWAWLNHRGLGDYVPSRLRPPNMPIYESLLHIRRVVHGAVELVAQGEPDPHRIAEYAASYTVVRRFWGLPARNPGVLRDIFEAQHRRLAAEAAARTEPRTGQPENSEGARRQTPWSGDASSAHPEAEPLLRGKPGRPTPWQRSASSPRAPERQSGPTAGTASSDAPPVPVRRPALPTAPVGTVSPRDPVEPIDSTNSDVEATNAVDLPCALGAFADAWNLGFDVRQPVDVDGPVPAAAVSWLAGAHHRRFDDGLGEVAQLMTDLGPGAGMLVNVRPVGAAIGHLFLLHNDGKHLWIHDRQAAKPKAVFDPGNLPFEVHTTHALLLTRRGSGNTLESRQQQLGEEIAPADPDMARGRALRPVDAGALPTDDHVNEPSTAATPISRGRPSDTTLDLLHRYLDAVETADGQAQELLVEVEQRIPDTGERAYARRFAENERRAAALAEELGIPLDRLRTLMAEELRKLFDGEIVTRATAGSLRGILESGRFKTEFDFAGQSRMGRSLLAGRVALEQALFGYPPDLPAQSRPIYGFIRTAPSYRVTEGDALAQYGDVDIVFKPAVEERTTANVGDTKSVVAIPSKVTDPQPESFAATPHGHKTLGYIGLEGIDRDYTGKRFTGSTYIEAQVHGATVADIDYVVFHASPPDQHLRELLNAAGIPWSHFFRNPSEPSRTVQAAGMPRTAPPEAKASEPETPDQPARGATPAGSAEGSAALNIDERPAPSKAVSDRPAAPRGMTRPAPPSFAEFRAALCTALAAATEQPDPEQVLADATEQQMRDALRKLTRDQLTVLRGLKRGATIFEIAHERNSGWESVVVNANQAVKRVVRSITKAQTQSDRLFRALAEATPQQIQEALRPLGPARRVVMGLFRDRQSVAAIAVTLSLDEATIKLMAAGAVKRIAREIAKNRGEDIGPTTKATVPPGVSTRVNSEPISAPEAELLVEAAHRDDPVVLQWAVEHFLTGRQRQVGKLLFLDGVGVQDAAKATNLSESQITHFAGKARVNLAKHLSERLGPPQPRIPGKDDSRSRQRMSGTSRGSGTSGPSRDTIPLLRNLLDRWEQLSPSRSAEVTNSQAVDATQRGQSPTSKSADTRRSRAHPMQSGHPDTGLTGREVEVIGLAAQGLSVREIARTLGIAPHSAESHLGRARRKLVGAGTRAEAIAEAERLGIFGENAPGESHESRTPTTDIEPADSTNPRDDSEPRKATRNLGLIGHANVPPWNDIGGADALSDGGPSDFGRTRQIRKGLRGLSELHIDGGGWVPGGGQRRQSRIDPDEAAVAAVRDLPADRGDLNPDLTLEFVPLYVPDGLRTEEDLEAVATAVADMMRERGWRDRSQIEAVTELVRGAGRNAMTYMERYTRTLQRRGVEWYEEQTAVQDMKARLTLRMSTQADARSLYVSFDVDQYRPERSPDIEMFTWHAPLFSHAEVGAEVRGLLDSATVSGVEQWGEVWARFDEPRSEPSGDSVVEPSPRGDLEAKAHIVRKLFDDHRIRFLGWEDSVVPVQAVESADRALRDLIAEYGGRFALRYFRFDDEIEGFGLTQSFGTTVPDTKDYYVTVTLNSKIFTDPEFERTWAEQAADHRWAQSAEDMIYQLTHHEFLHVVADEGNWALHHLALAMLRAAYKLYRELDLIPADIGYTEWLALLPHYSLLTFTDPVTDTFNPIEGVAEGARAGAVESSLPLTHPARVLHWLTVTRDGSSPAEFLARWAQRQASGEPDISLLLQDFRDVTGRDDIAMPPRLRPGDTTVEVLAAATGGHPQHFADAAEIEARLRAWDESSGNRGNGVSALVVLPEQDPYLLVRRASPDGTTRIELRNPVEGVLRANHVPSTRSPGPLGARAMFFDQTGAAIPLPLSPESQNEGDESSAPPEAAPVDRSAPHTYAVEVESGHFDPHVDPAVAAGLAPERFRHVAGRRRSGIIPPDAHLAFHRKPENGEEWGEFEPRPASRRTPNHRGNRSAPATTEPMPTDGGGFARGREQSRREEKAETHSLPERGRGEPTASVLADTAEPGQGLVVEAVPHTELTAALASYGDTGDGWTGADSTYSRRLPDGRHLWMFSDTFLGTVHPDGSRPATSPMVKNTFVVDDQGRMSTVHGGTADAPTAVVPSPKGQMLWVGGGYVTGNVLNIMLVRFVNNDPDDLMWGLTWDENVLARFDADDLSLIDLTPMPSQAGVMWSAWLDYDGTHTYVYGTEESGSDKYMHVARVSGDDLRARWEFFDGEGWTPNENDSARIMPGVANEYSVTRWRDRYLLITQDTSAPFSAEIWAYLSDSPTGPFTSPTLVYRAPEAGATGSFGDPNVYAYNAHEHPDLRSGDTLIVSYNVNSLDFEGVVSDVSKYRPRFVTVRLNPGFGSPSTDAAEHTPGPEHASIPKGIRHQAPAGPISASQSPSRNEEPEAVDVQPAERRTETSADQRRETDRSEPDAPDGLDPATNPVLAAVLNPAGDPAFDRMEAEHFPPVFEYAMRMQLAAIDDIVAAPGPWTADNALRPFVRSGLLLGAVKQLFAQKAAVDRDPATAEAEPVVAELQNAHESRILTDSRLATIFQNLHERRGDLDLSDAELGYLERKYKDFRNAGAYLSTDLEKRRLSELNSEVAVLQTAYKDNQERALEDVEIRVDDAAELRGLTGDQIEGARSRAGENGGYLLPKPPAISGIGYPYLTYLNHPALRQRIYEKVAALAITDHDNSQNVLDQVRGLAERAEITGHNNHAEFVMSSGIFDSTTTVKNILDRIARATATAARVEFPLLAEAIGAETIQPWDRHRALDVLISRRVGIDEQRIREFFELDQVLGKGVFRVAKDLFELTITEVDERNKPPVWHEDVRVFAVLDKEGQHLTNFYFDPYARAGKNGGEWTDPIRLKFTPNGQRPLISVHLNLEKPPTGRPTLLAPNEVDTLFHEFGHALHFLLGAGTHEPAKRHLVFAWIEFVAKVFQQFWKHPDVVANYAVHHQTGEPMPPEMLEKLDEWRTAYRGTITVFRLAGAYVDLAWSSLPSAQVPQGEDPRAIVQEFEKTVLTEAGIYFPEMRNPYPSQWFRHLFAQMGAFGTYSGQYWSYLLSDVLASIVFGLRINPSIERHRGLTPETGKLIFDEILRYEENNLAQATRRLIGSQPPVEHFLMDQRLLWPEALLELGTDATPAWLTTPAERPPGTDLESWWNDRLTPALRAAMIQAFPSEVLAMDIALSPETVAAAEQRRMTLLEYSRDARTAAAPSEAETTGNNPDTPRGRHEVRNHPGRLGDRTAARESIRTVIEEVAPQWPIAARTAAFETAAAVLADAARHGATRTSVVAPHADVLRVAIQHEGATDLDPELVRTLQTGATNWRAESYDPNSRRVVIEFHLRDDTVSVPERADGADDPVVGSRVTRISPADDAQSGDQVMPLEDTNPTRPATDSGYWAEVDAAIERVVAINPAFEYLRKMPKPAEGAPFGAEWVSNRREWFHAFFHEDVETLRNIELTEKDLLELARLIKRAPLYMTLMLVNVTGSSIDQLVHEHKVDWRTLFFTQEKITRDGETIPVWKFRTLRVDAPPEEASDRNVINEITPWARLQRTTSMDELPQLALIAAGIMQYYSGRPMLNPDIELMDDARRRGVITDEEYAFWLRYLKDDLWSAAFFPGCRWLEAQGDDYLKARVLCAFIWSRMGSRAAEEYLMEVVDRYLFSTVLREGAEFVLGTATEIVESIAGLLPGQAGRKVLETGQQVFGGVTGAIGNVIRGVAGRAADLVYPTPENHTDVPGNNNSAPDAKDRDRNTEPRTPDVGADREASDDNVDLDEPL
jgi:Zn-dependent oligopeptidase/DNA-binding CsgD family transcriptional regulator/DNA-binding LacI/PurR family transcriptional regulator/serine/threonine protein phosphatase PrpC/DNA-directed RNA polymerase specialized sigma subunit